MEWTMPVNDYLRDEITKIDHTLIPPGITGDVRTIRLVQDSLSRVIDNLGSASASAQGLSKVITTADKLRKTPNHILYLLKDAQAKGGSGEVIGILKIGRKHLYLNDEYSSKVRESEPLCVLDFYIVSDRQRHGYGRIMFDHMLRDNGTSAHMLAIDGPSNKMEMFLIKNYHVGKLIRQNNNFAVCPQFFEASTDVISTPGVGVGVSTPGVSGCGGAMSITAKSPAVGRFTAHKPHSTIASVIHGGDSDHHTTPTPTPTPTAGSTNGETEHKAEVVPEPEPEPEPECEPLAVQTTSASAPDGEDSSTTGGTLKRPQWLGLVEPEAGGGAGAGAGAARRSPASLERRDSQLTTQGYFDVKFYHNKLW